MQPPWQLFLVRGTGSIGLHTYYCQSLVTACTHFWKFEQLVSGEEINISIGTKSIYQEIWGTGHNCLGKYVRSNSVFCSQLCFIRCPEVGDCRLWLTWEKRGSRDSFESNGCGWLDTIMPNHTQPFVRKFECYLQAVSWSWLRFFFNRWMGKTRIEMEQQTEARGLEFWTKGLQIAIGLCVYIYT